MRAIPPQIIEIPGHVVQQVNILNGISNVVTLICQSNARPTLLKPFTPSVLRAWRRIALLHAGHPRVDELAKALRATSNNTGSPIQIFMRYYADVAAALVSSPSYYENAGAQLAQDLLLSTSWERKYVTSPSLGFPREYLQLTADPDVGLQPFGLPAWVPPTELKINSEDPNVSMEDKFSDDGSFRDAIGQLCMLMDRVAMSEELIPAAKTLVSRDPKEPHWGTARAAIQQSDRLTAIGLLYTHQADAFWLRFSSTLFTLCSQLAQNLFPRERAVLDFAAKVYEAAKQTIPCHPVLDSIAGMYAQVTMSTYYGVRPVAFRHGPDVLEGASPSGSTAADAAGTPHSRLVQLLVAQAMAEYARLSSLSQSGVAWPAKLLEQMAPDIGPVAISQITPPKGKTTGRTYGDIVEWLARNERYTTLWPEVVRGLGWGGAVRSPAIQIQAAGADFVLTDGDYYSDNPIAVLSGLRPALSMANLKVTGFPRRFKEDFNTGATVEGSLRANDGGSPETLAIMWSTGTVLGHVAAVNGGEAFSRFYMPTGMSMGEMGGEARFHLPGTKDAIGSTVAAYYAGKSAKGYVRHYYGDPLRSTSKQEPDVTYQNTDWDAWAFGASKDRAQEAMLAGYGPDNVDKGAVDRFLFRDRWNLRFPVQMVRTYELEWYDNIGSKTETMAYDGHIVFDDEVNLSQSVAPMDAFANLLQVDVPKGDEIGNAEIKAPETAAQ